MKNGRSFVLLASQEDRVDYSLLDCVCVFWFARVGSTSTRSTNLNTRRRSAGTPANHLNLAVIVLFLLTDSIMTVFRVANYSKNSVAVKLHLNLFIIEDKETLHMIARQFYYIVDGIKVMPCDNREQWSIGCCRQ